MFVALGFESVIVTVSWPPDTVREAEAVTLEFVVRLLSPVRFA